MGIVTQCPNGHRVKVKGDRVGKKAVCPTCGAAFRIAIASSADAAPAPPDGLPLAREVPLEPEVIATLPRALPFGSIRAAAQAADAAEARAAARVEPPAAAPASPAPSPAAPLPAASLPAAPSWDDEAQVVDVEDSPAPLRPRRRYIAAIADRPDLTWCIAYPGGDPSEPIDGPTMQDWLEGGQADGTEVVWRADWPQWHPIREVFPEFFHG
jgi:hypothetical protein